ncbi:hypothetical protein C8F01DRAFT_1186083, partial [Mycena amicta]
FFSASTTRGIAALMSAWYSTCAARTQRVAMASLQLSGAGAFSASATMYGILGWMSGRNCTCAPRLPRHDQAIP